MDKTVVDFHREGKMLECTGFLRKSTQEEVGVRFSETLLNIIGTLLKSLNIIKIIHNLKGMGVIRL